MRDGSVLTDGWFSVVYASLSVNITAGYADAALGLLPVLGWARPTQIFLYYRYCTATGYTDPSAMTQFLVVRLER